MSALRFAAAAVLPVVVLSGCRTDKDVLDDFERDLVAGRYGHAAIEVGEKARENGGNQLLWRLHAGSARRLSGQTSEAIDFFDAAEDSFAENDRESVFSRGATGGFAMLSNDRSFPFCGGGQDRVFACLYKAVDYAAANDVAAARTEFNRVAQHQENWLYERRRDVEAARDRLAKDAGAYARENKSEAKDCDGSVDKVFADADFSARIREKTGFDPATDGNLDLLSRKDFVNVYAQHVCGVFRWLVDGDGADVLKGLDGLCPGNEMVARDGREARMRAKPVNQVWIYVEDGLSPRREEWRLDLPLAFIPYANRYVLYAGMALPYLRYRDPGQPGYSVVAGGCERPLRVLQDVDRLLKVEHDVYFRGALAREITRVLVKAGAQAALGAAAENTGDRNHYWALKASQVAAAAWAASTTAADLRSWTALPKCVWAVRVERPADGKISLGGTGGPVAEITVPAGNSLVFVTKPAAGAVPSVRMVTF